MARGKRNRIAGREERMIPETEAGRAQQRSAGKARAQGGAQRRAVDQRSIGVDGMIVELRIAVVRARRRRHDQASQVAHDFQAAGAGEIRFHGQVDIVHTLSASFRV